MVTGDRDDKEFENLMPMAHTQKLFKDERVKPNDPLLPLPSTATDGLELRASTAIFLLELRCFSVSLRVECHAASTMSRPSYVFLVVSRDGMRHFTHHTRLYVWFPFIFKLHHSLDHFDALGDSRDVLGLSLPLARAFAWSLVPTDTTR